MFLNTFFISCEGRDEMRISSKGRYAVAAMTELAGIWKNGGSLTVLRISEALGISKIYLEQVFSLLKRAQLVISIKGAQGGYQLARAPEKITAADILAASELGLFEKTEATVGEAAKELEPVFRGALWDKLDSAVLQSLSAVSLAELSGEAERIRSGGAMMFYI